MKQTAALIVFAPGVSKTQVEKFLSSVGIEKGFFPPAADRDVSVERVQVQEFDSEIGQVVIYQP